jgi:hypothetical protein
VIGFLVSTRIRVAQGLVIAALALLLIYAADAGAASAFTNQSGVLQERGFLPIDHMTRGILFGGGAIALSTTAFFVSWKQRSLLVAALLVTNGILATIGGVMPLLRSDGFSHETTMVANGAVFITLGLGLWVIALGIAKFVMQAKAMEIKKSKEQATSA